jgi:linoleoyl-CoA desaturase
MNKVTFPKHTNFRSALQHDIDGYFAERQLARRDSLYMYAKAMFFVAWAIVSYAALVFRLEHPALLALAALSLALALVGIGFNIMHDGNHGGFSRHWWVNRVAGWSLDVIGASSFYWRDRHNVQHHTFTSISGKDSDIEHQPFARLSSDQSWYWYHRYQHLYMWFLYSVVHIRYVYSDFQRVIVGRNGVNDKSCAPHGWELVEFIMGKAVYFCLAFVIPMLLYPVGNVLAFYVAVSLLMGLMFAVVNQLGHMVDIVEHPADVDGMTDLEWTKHQIVTTASFAIDSRFWLFMVGGLNCQRIHHLEAQVAHVHYPALERIVERVCREYGVRCYSNPTFTAAIRSHWRWLKLMGQGQAA